MTSRRQKKRDWFRIIRDLMKAGVSMHKVAERCGRRATGTVQHWCEGGEPKDSDARVVLALYKQHCPEAYEKHMREFEPDLLDMQKTTVFVGPNRDIRGRPLPKKVAVVRTPPGLQDDLFEECEA